MFTTNGSMTRSWRARLLSLVAGIGLSVLVAETIVRTFFPHSRDTVIPGHLFMIDDELGWKFRPSRTSIHRTRHFAVEYTINASGFRDQTRPVARRPGTYRILLYGDSQVFGWGLPQADRFSDLIERRTTGLEVWNRAVPGYGVDQEVLSYERDAESLSFNEAMFFVGGGTLGRIRTEYIYGKYKPVFSRSPDGGLNVKRVPQVKNRIMTVLYEMLSPLYLPYFLQNQLASTQQSFFASALRNKKLSDEPEYVSELGKAILQRARLTARRKHQRMSVLVNDLSPADRKELRYFCEQNDIDFLEIPRDIAATSTTNDRMDLVLGRYDRHWNVKANGLIADQLEQDIRRRVIAIETHRHAL